MDFSRHSSFSGSPYLDCKADKEVNMENLKATALIVPVIALILIIILYLQLLKHSNSRSVFKRVTYLIISFSLLLNFAWEMLQMPLFLNMLPGWQSTLFCILASVADTIMVLLIYYGFALLYNNNWWMIRPGPYRLMILVLTGGAGAVLAELRHINLGTWGYSTHMPMIPGLKVGLVPVLQFMLLPGVIYFLAISFKNKN